MLGEVEASSAEQVQDRIAACGRRGPLDRWTVVYLARRSAAHPETMLAKEVLEVLRVGALATDGELHRELGCATKWRFREESRQSWEMLYRVAKRVFNVMT